MLNLRLWITDLSYDHAGVIVLTSLEQSIQPQRTGNTFSSTYSGEVKRLRIAVEENDPQYSHLSASLVASSTTID